MAYPDHLRRAFFPETLKRRYDMHPSQSSRIVFPAATAEPPPLILPAPVPDALPNLQAPIAQWCSHVSRICKRLRQASSADDTAFWSAALRRTAEGYLHRAFQPVRYEEDLMTTSYLAMCFAWHGCADAVSRLAEEFASLEVPLAEFDVVNAELLCDLACAFVHGRAGDRHVTYAMRKLADEVQHRLTGDQDYFGRRSIEQLLVAFDARDRIQADAIRELERSLQQSQRGPGEPEHQAGRTRRNGYPHSRQGDSNGKLSAMTGEQLSWHAKHLGRRPKDVANKRAMEALVQFLADACRADVRLSRYGWYDLAGVANGLSKFVSKSQSRAGKGLSAIAIAICSRDDADGPAQASGVEVSLLVNALSKRAGESGDKECNEALSRLAWEVSRRDLGERQFDSVALTNLVNGLSKHAGKSGGKACSEALSRLAREVSRRDLGERQFDSVALTNLVNGVSKRAGESGDKACNEALSWLAREVNRRDLGERQFEGHHLSNLVNGVSKRAGESGDKECNEALSRLAREVTRRDLGEWQFEGHHLSNLVNGVSKRAGESGDKACNQALSRLAREVNRRELGERQFDSVALSNLVNGVSKRVGESGDKACNEALSRLAREVSRRDLGERQLGGVELTNLINGVSKRAGESGDKECNEALSRLAREVTRRDLGERQFNSVALSNLVNGASKRAGELGDKECNEALSRLAREVNRRELGERQFDNVALTILVNGVSKRMGESGDRDCNEALSRLAREVSRRDLGERQFDSVALTNLVNGLSKRAGESGDKECNEALSRLAREVSRRDLGERQFNSVALTNLVNGVSKRVGESGDKECNEALSRLAREVNRRELGERQFEGHHLSNLVNGVSKRAGELGDKECNEALSRLAREVNRRDLGERQFEGHHLSNLVNGVSKRVGESGDKACNEALSRLAREVNRRDLGERQFDNVALTILVNGVSKRMGESGDRDCNEALSRLAREVSRRDLGERQFDNVALTILVNGVSKRVGESGDKDCNEALSRLAQEVNRRDLGERQFDSVALSNLVNGLSRLTLEPECREAIGHVARYLIRVDQPTLLDICTDLQSSSCLCHALSHCAQHELSPTFQNAALNAEPCIIALKHIAARLLSIPARNFAPPILSLALLLRAMHVVGLATETQALAAHGWNHLQHLVESDRLSSTNLETVGTIGMALLALTHGRTEPALRKKALVMLANTVLPAAWRKIALRSFPTAPGTPAHTEATGTRFPEYSYYAIARVGAEVARHWTRRNTQGNDRRDLAARRQRLQTQSRMVWERLCAINNGDISRASWNMIAQLEAESPSTILDDFVTRHWGAIKDQPPAARFDWHQVFDELGSPPCPPPPGKGVITVPRSDFAGRTPSGQAPQPRYSILARLSAGALPLLQVDLPTTLTPFVLGRAVHHQGVAYRVDVTGGSGMKPQRARIEQAFANTEEGQVKRREDTPGRLYALRVTDTGAGTDFARLMESLFPYTEAYYYFQRALMSSPPDIAAAHGPAAHVLEGTFRMAVLPDCRAGEHPFQLRDRNGSPIALQPHDGMGFIRESVARRFAWYVELSNAQREPFGGREPQANLPPDALQHYRGEPNVAAELAGKLPDDGDQVRLYRALTQGEKGKGQIAKAVPSATSQVVLPASKPVANHVLLGRAPYESAKLQPVADAQVLRGDDATARFLDHSPWLQYSFVCRGPDRSLSFFKGGLLVVPDGQWPAEYAERELVFSAEDEKSRSGWREGKARHREEARLDCPAMLAITEAFGPGSCVAVPLALQKAMGGDYDGDDVLVMSGLPALHGLVIQHQASHVAPELKLPKTHTPAYREGRYVLGRAAQIAATRLNVLGRYTVLQRRLLLLPQAQQQLLAQQVLGALCQDGLNKELAGQIETLLEKHQPTQAEAQTLLGVLDSRAATSHTEQARAWFAGLAEDVRRLVGMAESGAQPDALAALLPSRPVPGGASERLSLWLAHLPWAGPALPEETRQAYRNGDHREGLAGLLMLGIKAGEDAYKSDTGVRLFDRIGRKLERLYGEHQVAALVPYSRATMGLLVRRQFDGDVVRQYRETLRETPNLAGAVMREMLGQWLKREPAPDTGVQTGRALAQREARELGRERVHEKVDSAPRARKRKREEPEEHRVRQRVDTGGTAAPRAANAGAGNSRALSAKQQQ